MWSGEKGKIILFLGGSWLKVKKFFPFFGGGEGGGGRRPPVGEGSGEGGVVRGDWWKVEKARPQSWRNSFWWNQQSITSNCSFHKNGRVKLMVTHNSLLHAALCG